MFSIATKEKPGIPMPAAVAAVWGGFLFEGLMTPSKHSTRTDDILQAWNQGCIELVIAVSLFLPEVWQQICEVWESSDADFPGVFEYEVLSPLGSFLGDYLLVHEGKLPDPDTVKAMIAELIRDFFAQAPQAAVG